MGKFIYIISLFLHIPLICNSQAVTDSLVEETRSLKLNWENDVVINTDYYYTQGLSLRYSSPQLKLNPLNYLFYKPNTASKYLFSLTLYQQLYTPENIRSDELQVGDRPYAGLMYLKSSMETINNSSKTHYTAEFDIGLIGPYAFGRHTQYSVHEITDNPLPEGWDNQLSGIPVINYNIGLNKGILDQSLQDMQLTSKVRLGTLYDDLALGINYRIGYMDNYFDSFGGKFTSDNESFNAFLFAHPSVKLVGYNATFQGGMFMNNENQHTLPSSEMERLVYSFQTGATVLYNKWGTTYRLNWLSPEFKDGKKHFYQSIIFFYNF